jgi:hypothetical protein
VTFPPESPTRTQFVRPAFDPDALGGPARLLRERAAGSTLAREAMTDRHADRIAFARHGELTAAALGASRCRHAGPTCFRAIVEGSLASRWIFIVPRHARLVT